jgi:hypothetical protein
MQQETIAAAIRGGGWSELTKGQQRPYLRAAARVIAAIEQDKRLRELAPSVARPGLAMRFIGMCRRFFD